MGWGNLLGYKFPYYSPNIKLQKDTSVTKIFKTELQKDKLKIEG